MTEKETVAIIRVLKAYYPYVYSKITPEEAKAIIDVWMVQFKDFDYEIIKRAVDKWGGIKKTPPSIAELKESLFDFYNEYDMAYSNILKDPNADPKEVERIERTRNALWNCAYK